MRLWYLASPPQTFAAQRTYPRLVLFHSVTHIKLCNRIATLKLFELYHPQLTAYPAIQFFQFTVASDIAIVVYPAGQGKIETGNYF